MSQRGKTLKKKYFIGLIAIFFISLCFFLMRWEGQSRAAGDYKVMIGSEEVSGTYEMTSSVIKLSIDGDFSNHQTVTWEITDPAHQERAEWCTDGNSYTMVGNTQLGPSRDCYIRAVKFGEVKLDIKVKDSTTGDETALSAVLNIGFHIDRSVSAGQNYIRKATKNAELASIILKDGDQGVIGVNVGNADKYTWRSSDENVATVTTQANQKKACITSKGAGHAVITVVGDESEDTIDVYVIPKVAQEGIVDDGTGNFVITKDSKVLKTNALFVNNSTELIYDKMAWGIYRLSADGRTYTLLEDSFHKTTSDLVELSSVSTSEKQKIKVTAFAGQYVVKFWPKGIFTGEETAEELEYIDEFSAKATLNVRADYSNRDVTLCVGDKLDLAMAVNVAKSEFLSDYEVKLYEGDEVAETTNTTYISKRENVITADKPTNSTYVRVEILPKDTAVAVGADGTKPSRVVFKIRVLENLLLSGSNVSLYPNQEMQLYVTTGNNSGELKWETSDENYVTVDSTGLIKGIKSTSDLKDGYVLITVYLTLPDGSTRVASCKVVVEDTISNISLSSNDLQLLEGASTTVRASFSPDRNEAPLQWISSDESVFTINAATDKKSAVITAVKAGTGVLTLMNENDFVTAVCKVTVTAEMTSLTLPSEAMTVSLKQEYVRLTPSFAPDTAKDNKLIWTSSDETVATVDSEGMVTLLKAGMTMITVRPTFDSTATMRAQCMLTVQQSSTGIEMEQKNITMECGSNQTLAYNLLPSKDTVTTLDWKSLDQTIVTVDQEGKVTAVAPGNTYVVVTTAEGYSDICAITVTQKATGITLEEEKIRVGTGATTRIGYTLDPVGATSTVRWRILDTNIATVDDYGNITGVAAGKTTVIASAEEYLATCEVEVYTSATGVNLVEENISLDVGATAQLNYEVTPVEAETNLTWTSMDETIATVDANGLVTAISVGETYIVMTSTEGFVDTCKVSIKQVATGVSLVDTQIALVKGDTHNILYQVTPENAVASVTWASMDETIATVDANGLVTAIAVGTTNIVMTSVLDGHTEICKVIVTDVSVGITLTENELTLAKGVSKNVEYKLEPEDATTVLTWTSLNETVATVDQEGKVTAVAVGSTYIMVTSADGYSATCKVNVTQVATTLTLGNTSLTIGVGDTYTVPVKIEPEDATDITVGWSSKDPAIATVSAEGMITGVAVGETTVFAKLGNGEVAYLSVTVKSLLKGITLDKTEETIASGVTTKLTVNFNPADASDQTVTWTSSNEAVATVLEDGTVTGVAGGVAIITCTANTGGYTAICIINVTEQITSLTLDKTSCKVAINKSVQLTATVANTTATNQKLKWTTSNKKIAKVDNTGKVTAKKKGKCKIKVQATDGSGASATCKITVVRKVNKLLLNHNYIKVMEGRTAKLKAKVKPTSATSKTLAWSSSDQSIALVNSNGKINALAPGMVEISVETTDGTKLKATCTVEVVEEKPVTSMTVSAQDMIMVQGTAESASVVISPTNTTDKIKYESDAKSVATVTSKGKITARRPGNATISVTSSSGQQVCINVTVVGLNKTSLSLQQYDSDELWVEEVPDAVKWSSSNPAIARVENGRVVARKVGFCTITASVRGVKLNCKVKVNRIR